MLDPVIEMGDLVQLREQRRKAALLGIEKAPLVLRGFRRSGLIPGLGLVVDDRRCSCHRQRPGDPVDGRRGSG